MALGPLSRSTSRREILQTSGILVGAGLLSSLAPKNLFGAREPLGEAFPQQSNMSVADRVAQMRAQMANIPLASAKLRENLFLLSGPGGNMVALAGADVKVLVDSSFASVVPQTRKALDAMGSAPLNILINTHWHFDHTDGNAGLHDAGATILAHENTRKRLSTPQEMKALGLHFNASPAAALPQLTFTDTFSVHFSGETLELGYFPPAHTDTDIYIHYLIGDVLHMGDIWFNAFYPLIDTSTGGNIDGMIAAADKGTRLAGPDTKIVPGHGPVGNKGDLEKYRDMLVTVRDRVKAQKSAGKTAEEVVASKPTSDLDATWGHGSISPDFFVNFVYSSL